MNRKASKGTRMNTSPPLWRKIAVSLSLGLVLSLLLASPSFADIDLRVRVIDSCNRQPIERALVEVLTSMTEIGGVREGITGPDGWATINPVRPGPFDHTIGVTKEGYQSQEVTRHMEADTKQEVVVELTPLMGCQPPPCQLAKIIVDPSVVNMQVGEKQLFTATGLDLDGNDCPITNPAWTATGGGLDPACQGSTSCTYTATKEGDYTVTCTESGADIWGTADAYNFAYRELVKIIVSPSEVDMQVGEEQTFTATGKDQQGNPCEITDPVWATSDGGTLTPKGTSATYTATVPGDYTVTCTQDATDIFGMAKVNTTRPCGVVRIEVVLGALPMSKGDQRQCEATAYDANGDPVPMKPIWSATGGTITQDGLYTANEVGDHTITASVPDCTVQGSAHVPVIEALTIPFFDLPCPLAIAPLAGFGIGGLVVWRRRPARKR